MKLQLSKFDKIIFDMDGVITSEIAYWQSAACTCYDLLLNYKHYGSCGIDREWGRKNYLEIYNVIFCGGKTIKAVKRLGVNSNWDLAYIVFCVSKYLNPELTTLDEAHFQSVCMFIENIDMKAPKIYDAMGELVASVINNDNNDHFKRGGNYFWAELVSVFQDWYLGTDGVEGIKVNEELLFPPADIENVLKKLTDKGIRLGIGTGRPRTEIEYPLNRLGFDKYFDKNMYVTYDDVLSAEESIKPTTPLGKPEPFVFLKAALGEKYSDREIYDAEYRLDELSRTLVVGDAACDMLSAHHGGMQFLAVLTGIDGDSARQYFVENKADYIFENVLKLAECED